LPTGPTATTQSTSTLRLRAFRSVPRVPQVTQKRSFFLGRSGDARATACSAASGFRKASDQGPGVESPFIFRCLTRPGPLPDHHDFVGEYERASSNLTRVHLGHHCVDAYRADRRPWPLAPRVRAAHGLGTRQACARVGDSLAGESRADAPMGPGIVGSTDGMTTPTTAAPD